MSGKFSKDKGRRGEQDIARRVGGRRLGIGSGLNPVDVESPFANYQVKNKAIGSGAILDALKMLPDNKAAFVAFKPRNGVWLIAETLEQHIDHHVGIKEAE